MNENSMNETPADPIEVLGDAIVNALNNADLADVVAVLTGALTSLADHLADMQPEHNPTHPITMKVDGVDRFVTVSARIQNEQTE